MWWEVTNKKKILNPSKKHTSKKALGLSLLESKVTLLPYPNANRNLSQRAVVVLLSSEQGPVVSD